MHATDTTPAIGQRYVLGATQTVMVVTDLPEQGQRVTLAALATYRPGSRLGGYSMSLAGFRAAVASGEREQQRRRDEWAAHRRVMTVLRARRAAA